MFLMPSGEKEISKIEKDSEVVQEKKISQLCYVSRAAYIQHVMKTSSLGWFIDWQELES